MTSVERLFALRCLPLLDRLRDAEIGLVARACQVRDYGSGEQVASADRPLQHLHVIAEGSVEREGARLPRVFGEASLLLGRVPGAPLIAGSSGARCLLLARGHFFTLVNECPWLMTTVLDRLAHEGLAEMGIAMERQP